MLSLCKYKKPHVQPCERARWLIQSQKRGKPLQTPVSIQAVAPAPLPTLILERTHRCSDFRRKSNKYDQFLHWKCKKTLPGMKNTPFNARCGEAHTLKFPFSVALYQQWICVQRERWIIRQLFLKSLCSVGSAPLLPSFTASRKWVFSGKTKRTLPIPPATKQHGSSAAPCSA